MTDFLEYDIDFNDHCLELTPIIEQDSEEDTAPPSLSSNSNFDVDIDIDIVESEKSTSKKKGKKAQTHRSKWWMHEAIINGEKMAVCKYCKNTFQKSGTGNMAVHIKQRHPHKLLNKDGKQLTLFLEHNRKNLDVQKVSSLIKLVTLQLLMIYTNLFEISVQQ